MKVILNSHYRGPFRNAFGATLKVFDLQPGENDLSPEEVEYIQRDAPEIFVEAPVLPKKEVAAAPVDKMVKKGTGLTTKNVFGRG